MAGSGRRGRTGLTGFTVVLACWIALAASLAAPGVSQQHQGLAQASDARLRLLHGLAGTSAIDVYIDGSLAMIGVVFGDVSSALTLPPGEHDFAIAPSGQAPDAALAAGSITLREGAAYYVALLGTSDAASVGLFAIDERPLDAGRARFRIISGVPDAEQIVPTFAGGNTLSAPLGFGDASEYATIDAGIYDLDMVDEASGVSLLPLMGTELAEGATTDIVLIGQVADASLAALIESSPVDVTRPTGLVASIVPGTCEDAEAPLADLGVVQPGQGQAVGVQGAPDVAQGFGLAPVAFGTLVASPHAVVITGDDDPEEFVACGEIGGQLTDTGALVVALPSSADGGMSGVAVLAPGLENPETTGVSIFLAGAN